MAVRAGATVPAGCPARAQKLASEAMPAYTTGCLSLTYCQTQ